MDRMDAGRRIHQEQPQEALPSPARLRRAVTDEPPKHGQSHPLATTCPGTPINLVRLCVFGQFGMSVSCVRRIVVAAFDVDQLGDGEHGPSENGKVTRFAKKPPHNQAGDISNGRVIHHTGT